MCFRHVGWVSQCRQKLNDKHHTAGQEMSRLLHAGPHQTFPDSLHRSDHHALRLSRYGGVSFSIRDIHWQLDIGEISEQMHLCGVVFPLAIHVQIGVFFSLMFENSWVRK